MNLLDGPVYNPKDYAGFWRRSTALVVDFLILTSVYVVVFVLRQEVLSKSLRTVRIAVMVEFGYFLFVLAYGFVFCLLAGGTPGYRIVGIRYAQMLSQETSAMQLLYRAAITLLMIRALFLIDHLWILFDPNKQTWHDKVSGFYVVRRKAHPIGTQKLVQRIVNFMALCFVVWEPLSTVRPVGSYSGASSTR